MEGGVGECHVPGQTPVGQCQTRANIAQRDARQWGAAAAPHKACGARTLSTPAPAASDLARDADEEQKAGEDGLRKAADAGESGRACNTSLEHCALPPAGAECSQCQTPPSSVSTCRPARRMLRRDRPPTRRAVERRPRGWAAARRGSANTWRIRQIARGPSRQDSTQIPPDMLPRPCSVARGACPERACVRDRGRGGGAEARGRCDARARRARERPSRARRAPSRPRTAWARRARRQGTRCPCLCARCRQQRAGYEGWEGSEGWEVCRRAVGECAAGRRAPRKGELWVFLTREWARRLRGALRPA